MHDLIVIGAGPSGSRLAFRAARAGLRTLLLEEHLEVGTPVHCTGIVGQEVLERYRIPPSVVRGEVSTFTVYSPEGRIYRLPGVRAWLLDRAALDRRLAEEAVAAGADLETGTRVVDAELRPGRVRVIARQGSRRVGFSARVAALATGAMTDLAYRLGLGRPVRFYRTAQITAEVTGLEGAELYLGRRLAPGSFAYAAGVTGRPAKLGAISRSLPWHGLRRLMEHLRREGRLQGAEARPVCRRIPMGVASRTVRGRLVAVGDAAGQAKTTTGGGIYYGLLCADLLADTLLTRRRAGDFDLEGLAGYDRLWKRCLGRELRVGNRLRQVFEAVEDEELEELVELLDHPEVRRVIRRQGHFDRHRPMLAGLAALPQVRRRALRLAARRVTGGPFFPRLYRALDAAAERYLRVIRRWQGPEEGCAAGWDLLAAP